MSWAKFDDSIRRNPKVLKAGTEAATFWIWAVLYAVEFGTDGHIDEALLHRIPPIPISPKRARELADRCVNASVRPGGFGLFERVEGGYRVHDFLAYQPSAEAERKRRSEASEAKSRAGKLGAASRWEKPAAGARADGKADGTPHGSGDGRPHGTAMANASPGEWQTHGPDPDPDPDPDPVPEKAAERGSAPKAPEPMSAEAKRIAEHMRKFPRLIAGLEHEIVRMADEQAGHMFAKGQKLQWVLDAIEACAAKTVDGLTAEARKSKLVGFMWAAKAPRGGDAERKPATSVAKSAEISPEQQAQLQKAQAEKQAKAEAAKRHLEANGKAHL